MRRIYVLPLAVMMVMAGAILTAGVGRAAAPAALDAPATPYPQLLQTIPVADAADLRDFRFDARAQRFYVTDRDDNLTVIDSETYAVIATLPVGGDLLLDERNARLYAYPGPYGLKDGVDAPVTVIDTRDLAIVGTLPDASFVSVDPVYGRVFTGDRYSSYQPNNTTPVRVYDAATLSQTGVISTTGIPIYNPMRRDLVVLAYRAFAVDLVSGEEVADLLPDQTSQPFEFCNGCDVPTAAHMFPERNLLVVEMERIATGGGGGVPPSPRYFDATTLRELAAADLDLMFQPTCGTQPALTPAIDGRLYRNQNYLRYIFLQNWSVYDAAGERLALRDGVYANFVNPSTRQAIIDQGYVVDLATLLPIGRFPAFCWFAYDAVSGRFFGRSGGDLLVMAETGGTPEQPESPIAAEQPVSAIAQIVPSPSLPDDGTVFVSTYQEGVLRSTDGGDTWVQLRGGLPQTEDLKLTLAVSPDFAQDRTLFAGGEVPMFRGEGVLKSTDGGDSWTPFWQGMDYLRVQKVAVSPDFASDRRVAAQVVYNEIEPWQDGVAVYASDDAGLAWSRAITAESASDAAYVAAWAATAKLPEAPVRLDMYTGLEVTQDGGLTWRGIDLGLADADYLSEVAIAPDYPDDAAIYVRSRLALFRTNDGGQTWTRWDDPRLAGRDYANDLSALAVGRGATGHIVFLGTTNGELWRIPGADLTMTPVTMTVLAEPAPTPMPVAAATPIPAATPVLATPEPLAAEPPAGVYRPTGPLATWWEADADLQARLGWATTADPFPVAMAQQSFATGVMLWREDTHAIYVLSDDGHWSVYPDTFTEGEPESDPSLSPPAGYLQPIRGFGKVWRENPDVAERVGWARGREAAATGSIQPFERGVLIGTGLRTFALIEETPESGMWK